MIADDLYTRDAPQLRDALRGARAEAAVKQAVIDQLKDENTTCGWGEAVRRTGEDVAEKMLY